MGFKDLLVKLGVLKAGGKAGTYTNAKERTDVMGVNEEVDVDDDNDNDSDTESGSDSDD
jgi:hypothetical protein